MLERRPGGERNRPSSSEPFGGSRPADGIDNHVMVSGYYKRLLMDGYDTAQD